MAYQRGPSGGTGGEPFSDSPGTINHIIVHHGAYVDAIEIGWRDGTTSKHGEGGGPNVDTFVLNPDEHLTAIDGTIGNLPDDGGPYVVSIRFVGEHREHSASVGNSRHGSRHVRVPIHGSAQCFDRWLFRQVGKVSRCDRSFVAVVVTTNKDLLPKSRPRGPPAVF